jgi:hypothetical protein
MYNNPDLQQHAFWHRHALLLLTWQRLLSERLMLPAMLLYDS